MGLGSAQAGLECAVLALDIPDVDPMAVEKAEAAATEQLEKLKQLQEGSKVSKEKLICRCESKMDNLT